MPAGVPELDFEPSPDDPLRRATPSLDDVEARRARAAVAGRLFSQSPRAVKVGRYQIMERIGSGGMGMVYRAHDPELARDVAVKVMNADAFGEDEAKLARARLVREARAMARLAHPNVIHVYDVGTIEHDDASGPASTHGIVFIAMELVEGAPLDRWLECNRGEDWQVILLRLVDAGRGLAAAHAAGVIHRDFKPENVLVGEDGRVRVCDFGLAGGSLGQPSDSPHPAASSPRLSSASQSGRALVDATAVDESLTRTGALLGTPKYMAPEAESGAPASARSDQFSFCVALYEALHGYPPFRGDTVGEYRRNVRHGRVLPPPPDTRVKAWVHAEIVRGLAPDPAQRHPGMDALLERLESALPDPRRHARRRRRMWLAAALVTTAGATGVIGGAGWTRGRTESEPAVTRVEPLAAAPTPLEPAPQREPASAPEPEPVEARVPEATVEAPEVSLDRSSSSETEPDTSQSRPRRLSHCYFAQDKYSFITRSTRHKGMLRTAGRCYDCTQSVAHRRDSLVADDGQGPCDRFYECFEETTDKCAG